MELEFTRSKVHFNHHYTVFLSSLHFCFSSRVVYSKLILDPNAIYVVGIGKSPASYMLHVNSLSPSTGQLIASANIASNILDPLAHLAVLSRPGPTQAQALWIEQEKLRSVGLTPTLKEQVKLLKGTDYDKIQDVGLNDQGHVVISRKDGSSFVLKLDDKVNAAKSAWDFFDSVRFFRLEYPDDY